jgi:hypothetical protein
MTGLMRLDFEAVPDCASSRTHPPATTISISPACSALGVLCTNAPDGVTQSTADFAFGLLIAASRRIVEADALVRTDGWGPSTYESFMAPEISGSTLGILGMGRIGQTVTRRAAHGFRMRVLYCSRSRLSPALEGELGCARVGKERMLGEADHVMVTLPYSGETRHAIGLCTSAAATSSTTPPSSRIGEWTVGGRGAGRVRRRTQLESGAQERAAPRTHAAYCKRNPGGSPRNAAAGTRECRSRPRGPGAAEPAQSGIAEVEKSARAAAHLGRLMSGSKRH